MLKPVNGFNGEYTISDTGEVYSEYFRNNHARIKRRMRMKPNDNGCGYKYVQFCINGKRKRAYIHRLVAEHFLGIPSDGQVVNHKDHNRANNHVSNLEWMSQAENVRYSAEYMAHPKSRCKSTNTGEKYISRKVERGNVRFRVVIKSLNVSKIFRTLEEAVAFRNGVMNGA